MTTRDQLEELQRQGKQAQVYSKIRQMQKKSGKSGTSIKDKHGKLLTDEGEVRSRWKEYIEELYDKDMPQQKNKCLEELTA